MPAQLPVAAIISRSKLVRCSSRCASNNRPSAVSSFSRSVNSKRIASIACFSVGPGVTRSEEHTSEIQSLMRISYAVFCLKKKKQTETTYTYELAYVIYHNTEQ